MSRKIKAGILVFPGSNCDRDIEMVLKDVYKFETKFLWFTEQFSDEYDIYFLPGGFSYGDYLRSGALAAIAPSMRSLRIAVKNQKPVLGICNGFQILCESHLLPGALTRNSGLLHICDWVNLKGEGSFASVFPDDYYLPVSHSEGNYLCDDTTLKNLQDKAGIILTYKTDINGSMSRIAGIRSGKVYGLMPHPERAIYEIKDFYQSSRVPGKDFFDEFFAQAL